MGESMIKKKGRTLIDTRYAPSKLGRYKIQDMKKPFDSSISCIFVSCILYLVSCIFTMKFQV